MSRSVWFCCLRNTRHPFLQSVSTMNPRQRQPAPSAFRLGVAVAILLTCALSAAEPLRYNRDIRPILSDNCFACHGPDKAKRDSGLRLDIREEAIRPAESGDTAIVPGRPEQSQLITRIITDDPDEVMPPPKVH